MPSPIELRMRLRRRWRLVLPLLAALVLAPVVASAQTPESAAAATAEDEVRAEVDRLFQVTRLRDGVLLEPREEMNGIAAIEIDRGTFLIDGAVVLPGELDARLGSAADVVRRLGDLESRRRPETFGDDRPSRARPPSPPGAPDPPRPVRSRSRTDSQVVVGSSLVIDADEEARDVVVFGGRLTIRGQVIGDAVAIGGSVLLERGGEVTGDLAAIGGPATLEADTEVRGDVISVGGRLSIDDSAIVGGDRVEVPFGPQIVFGFPDSGDWSFDWDDDWWDHGYRGWWGFGRVFSLFWNFFGILLLALLACLAYLLARTPVERMARKVRSEAWKAGLVGLVAEILFVPLLVLVCVILVISIIGIPMLALVPFAILAVILVSFLGYTAVAYTIGSWAERRFGWKMVSPYVAIVVGVGLIQVISFLGDLLGLLPGPFWLFTLMFVAFGCILKYIVWTIGLGAALLTRFGTLDDYSGDAQPVLPPIPPPVGPDGPAPTAATPGAPDLDWETPAGGGLATGDEPWEPEVEPEPPADPERPDKT